MDILKSPSCWHHFDLILAAIWLWRSEDLKVWSVSHKVWPDGTSLEILRDMLEFRFIKTQPGKPPALGNTHPSTLCLPLWLQGAAGKHTPMMSCPLSTNTRPWSCPVFLQSPFTFLYLRLVHINHLRNSKEQILIP